LRKYFILGLHLTTALLLCTISNRLYSILCYAISTFRPMHISGRCCR